MKNRARYQAKADERRARQRHYYVENKERVHTREKQYQLRNQAKVKQRRRRHYLANRDRILARQKCYYHQNIENIKKYMRSYRAAKPEKILALSNKRRFAKQLATPTWLTKAHLALIESIYKKCPPGHHVDHIVPLINPLVCGLHVPWNLQILSAHENISKRNKLLPEIANPGKNGEACVRPNIESITLNDTQDGPLG